MTGFVMEDEFGDIPEYVPPEAVSYALNCFHQFLKEESMNEEGVRIDVFWQPVEEEGKDGMLIFIAHKQSQSFCRLDITYEKDSLLDEIENPAIKEKFAKKWREVWINSANIAKRRLLHINEEDRGKSRIEFADVQIMKSILGRI